MPNQQENNAKFKVALVFSVNDEDTLQALVMPVFENLTPEEEQKAQSLVCFVHGLLAEAKNNYRFYMAKGAEVLGISLEEEKIDLEKVEPQGNA